MYGEAPTHLWHDETITNANDRLIITYEGEVKVPGSLKVRDVSFQSLIDRIEALEEEVRRLRRATSGGAAAPRE